MRAPTAETGTSADVGADAYIGPRREAAPTRERRRRSGVAARRAADSRPYGEIGVGVAQRRKKDAVSLETASERVKKPPEAGNKPRRVSPPQRRNKIKIAISGDMRIGNRTLRPKRFDSFSKKTENLLGCSPLCQKSVAFLTV